MLTNNALSIHFGQPETTLGFRQSDTSIAEHSEQDLTVGERRERALQIAKRMVSAMNARGIGARKLQEGVRAYFVEQKLDP